jgi:hypothetical protein
VITITFIIAVVTGVVLAVKICQLPETREAIKVMLAEKTPVETAPTKDDCLTRGVIKF